MKAANISKKVLHLESGDVQPGSEGEFTSTEYSFLRGQQFVGPVVIKEEPEILTSKPAKRPAKKKAAPEQSTGFL